MFDHIRSGNEVIEMKGEIDNELIENKLKNEG